jgi:hypothetical protein
VATDILGVSGRAMLQALIAGERDPNVLADLAQCHVEQRDRVAGGVGVVGLGGC